MTLPPHLRRYLPSIAAFALLAALPVLYASLMPGVWWPLALVVFVHLWAGAEVVVTAVAWLLVCHLLYIFLPAEWLPFVATLGLAINTAVSTRRRRLVVLRSRVLHQQLVDRVDRGRVRHVAALAIALTVLWSLNRHVPIAVAALWLFTLIVFYRALPPSPRPVKRYAAEYGLLGLSVIASVLVLEFGLRAFVKETQRWGKLYEAAPDYAMTLRPDVRIRSQLPAADGTIVHWTTTISPQGFRDRVYGPKQPGEYRILMLGDSFTMGFVPLPDAIPKQLERILSERNPDKRITVINGGMDAAGPVQEWGILRDRGLNLNPDLVILELFPANDLNNCLAVSGKQLRAYSPAMFVATQRWMRIAEGDPAARAEMAIRRASRLYRELAFRFGNREFAAGFVRSLRFVHAPPPITWTPPIRRPVYMEVDLAETYPELEEGFGCLEDYVRRMQILCRENGVAFAAYCVPTKRNVDDGLWEASREERGTLEYVRNKGCDRVKRFFGEAGIPYFDVFNALQQAGPIDQLYWPTDSHLAKRGNEVVAGAAASFVEEHYLDFANHPPAGPSAPDTGDAASPTDRASESPP